MSAAAVPAAAKPAPISLHRRSLDSVHVSAKK